MAASAAHMGRLVLEGLWRRPSRGAPAALALGLIAAAAAAAVLFSGPSEPDIERDELLALLIESREAFAAPGRTVEEAAANLETPEAALAFVADEIVLADYAEPFLESDAVLVHRVANPSEKAVLLAALLQQFGLETRFRRLDWPEDLEPRSGRPSTDPPAPYRRLLAELRLNRRGEKEAAAGLREALQRQVREAGERFAEIAGGERPFGSAQRQSPLILVEARNGDGEWRQFNPVFPGTDLEITSASTYHAPGLKGFEIELFAEDPSGNRTRVLHWSGTGAQQLSVTFVPAAAAGGYFRGAPDAPEVALWMPVVVADGVTTTGKPFAGDGSVPEIPVAPEDAGSGFAEAPIPDIEGLELVAVDASRFPEMRASVEARLAGPAQWQSRFLSLNDGGERLIPRIVSQPDRSATGRSTMILLDISGSMDRHIPRTREIIRGLVDRLDSDHRVGLAYAGSGSRVVLPPRPIGDREAFKTELDALVVSGGGTYIDEGINAALAASEGADDIILIGDGDLGGHQNPVAIRERIEQDGSRIYSLLLGDNAANYRGFSTSLWTVLPDALPQSLLDQLSEALTDRLEIAWRAPPGSTVGDRRTVRLSSAGWAGVPAEATYGVPPDAAPASGQAEAERFSQGAGLVLRIDAKRWQEPVVERRIVDLDTPLGAEALQSIVNLYLVPGISPGPAVLAAYLDGWIDVFAALPGSGVSAPPAGSRHWGLLRGSSVLGFAQQAFGEPLRLEHPMMMIERVQAVRGGDGSLQIERVIDVLNPEALAPTREIADKWRVGLALAAGEAVAVGGDTGQLRLLPGEPTLVAPGRPLPGWFARQNALASERLERASLLLFEAAPDEAWILWPDGGSEKRLLAVSAKGARAQETIDEFTFLRNRLELYGILAGAAGSVGRVPGVALGGVTGLLNTNLKMYCFSSVMLGYVTDAMADELEDGEADPEVWRATASEGCKIDPENLQAEYTAGLHSGMVMGAAGDHLAAMGKRAYAASRVIPIAKVGSGVDAGLSAAAGYALTDLGEALNKALVRYYSQDAVAPSGQRSGSRSPPAHTRRAAGLLKSASESQAAGRPPP